MPISYVIYRDALFSGARQQMLSKTCSHVLLPNSRTNGSYWSKVVLTSWYIVTMITILSVFILTQACLIT